MTALQLRVGSAEAKRWLAAAGTHTNERAIIRASFHQSVGVASAVQFPIGNGESCRFDQGGPDEFEHDDDH